MSSSSIPLDAIDRALLKALQENARISNAELARRVELSPSGLQKRLTKLQGNGLIESYTAVLNRNALGYDLMCIVHINLDRHEMAGMDEFLEGVAKFPEVQECFEVTGIDDFILKIIVKDFDHLESFLYRELTAFASIDRIRSSVVLKEVKTSTAVPIDD